MKTRKLLLLLLAVVASVEIACAETYSGTCGDNLKWSLNTETGVLDIVGSGDMTNYSLNSLAPWYDERSSVKQINLRVGITSIGEYAFVECSDLTSVTMPNSVTSIGEGAFLGCISMADIAIPNSVTSIGRVAFFYCSSLKSITIPNSVTRIGERVFEHCTGLTSVTIGNRVTSISERAFYECSGMTSVTISNGVVSIDDYAFYGCRSLTSVTIPESVITIGSLTFYDCISLTSIIIPNSVASIGGGAFDNCSGLTSVTIGSNVTKMGYDTFIGCSGLKRVVLNSNAIADGSCSGFYFASYSDTYSLKDIFGTQVEEYVLEDSITTISEYAFYDCSGMTSVALGSSVTSIGNYAFEGCSGLKRVTLNSNAIVSRSYSYWSLRDVFGTQVEEYVLGESVTTIGEEAFRNCSSLTSFTIPNSVTSISEQAFSYCSGLTSVTIGDGVTNIGNLAFEGCSSLTSLTIGNSVTTIGENAFRDCSGLTTITLPNSVNTISRSAFYNCSGLTSVTIPNSVTSIGESAFSGCSGLTSVTIGKGVASIGDGVFDWCSSLIEIMVDSNNAIYDSRDGCNAIIETASNTLISGCRNTYIPNGVVGIADYAFYGCSGLETISIPNSVTNIGFRVFDGCSSLIKIMVDSGNPIYDSRDSCNAIIETESNTLIRGCENTYIPNSITSINDYAFSDCSGLVSISIPNSVNTIGRSAFYNCSGLTSITIPESVTNIGNYAFALCSDLTSVTIPNSLTSISNSTFHGCSSLTSITIPHNVITIGRNAFYWCTSLKEVTFGKSLTQIGSNAFASCDSIIKMTCYAEEPPTVLADGFANVSRRAYVYVPTNKLHDYQISEIWGDFDLRAITAETSGVDKVTITVGNSNAVVEWPAVENAATYDLVIKDKQGNTVCTLTFDSNGQLTNIAFRAPARDHSSNIAQRTQAGGFRFTVTGLDEGTNYDLTLSAKDNNNAVISSESVTFKTKSATASTYTIRFVNYDNTELLVLSDVEEGTVPVYTGETPTRAEDDEYTYAFAGWAVEGTTEVLATLPAATADVTYIAIYTTNKDTGIEDVVANDSYRSEDGHARKVLIDGTLYILTPDGKTYNALGAEVK